MFTCVCTFANRFPDTGHVQTLNQSLSPSLSLSLWKSQKPREQGLTGFLRVSLFSPLPLSFSLLLSSPPPLVYNTHTQKTCFLVFQGKHAAARCECICTRACVRASYIDASSLMAYTIAIFHLPLQESSFWALWLVRMSGLPVWPPRRLGVAGRGNYKAPGPGPVAESRRRLGFLVMPLGWDLSTSFTFSCQCGGLPGTGRKCHAARARRVARRGGPGSV